MSTPIRIVLLRDRSMSMMEIKDAVLSSFSEFIETQKSRKKEGSTVLVTIIDFDTTIEMVVFDKEIEYINPGDYDFVPDGFTALYDSCGKAIELFEKYDGVILGIITDGEENASKTYNGDIGKKKIIDKFEKLKKEKDWQIVFMGANQDSFQTGYSLGINQDNCSNFEFSQEGVSDVLRTFSEQCAVRQESGRSISMNTPNISCDPLIEGNPTDIFKTTPDIRKTSGINAFPIYTGPISRIDSVNNEVYQDTGGFLYPPSNIGNASGTNIPPPAAAAAASRGDSAFSWEIPEKDERS